MSYLDKYNVIFNVLPIGKHNFDFEIDDKFFEQFDYSDIKQGKLIANVELSKMNISSVVNITINGDVVTICDRCLDDVTIEIEYDGTLLIRYGEEPVNDAEIKEDVMYISHGEETINLAQYIYDSIYLGLPIQRVHIDESQCNAEMIEKLKEMTNNQTV